METIQQLRDRLDRRVAGHTRDAGRRVDPTSKYGSERRRSWDSPLDMAKDALSDAKTAFEAGDSVRSRRFLAIAKNAVRVAKSGYRRRHCATDKHWTPNDRNA